MMTAWGSADTRSRLNLIALGIFLCVLVFFGGASRVAEIGQPVVRIAAALLILSSGLQLTRNDIAQVRAPLLILLSGVVIAVCQLIPLPAELWSALPGREIYVSALETAELAGEARPLSLAPDMTLNALLSFIPPLAAVLTLALIDRRVQPLLVSWLLLFAAVSCFLAVVQVSSSSFYLYRITNFGSGVGVFANRNHQALLLACVFPLLASWASLPLLDGRSPGPRPWAAFLFAVLLFPLLFLAESRAGLVLGALGAAMAFAIARGSPTRWWFQSASRRPRRAVITLLVGMGVVLSGFFVLFSRDVALQRLLKGSDVELRWTILPTLIQMVRDFLPFGAGFGSFDPVFRAYEPLESLSTSYMNQAHNDLLQVVIEGGIPAAILVVASFAWILLRSALCWRGQVTHSGQLLGRAGSSILLLAMLLSVVDYPLRTPIFAVVFAICCCWLSPASRNRSSTNSLTSAH